MLFTSLLLEMFSKFIWASNKPEVYLIFPQYKQICFFVGLLYSITFFLFLFFTIFVSKFSVSKINSNLKSKHIEQTDLPFCRFPSITCLYVYFDHLPLSSPSSLSSSSLSLQVQHWDQKHSFISCYYIWNTKREVHKKAQQIPKKSFSSVACLSSITKPCMARMLVHNHGDG